MIKANSEQAGGIAVSSKSAWQFVILIGVVSLFGDMTYEAARSINGPFLAFLGAGAVVVAATAGFGELVGYGLRLFFGYLCDRTGRYWAITLTGYGINLLAVPLLALAGNWPMAAALMICERLGKAIRTPARDAMLSHAGSQVGTGWAFGLHEAMDQIGAFSGPLIVAAVLYYRGENYPLGYAILVIPALLALGLLVVARIRVPEPRNLECSFSGIQAAGMRGLFWLYMAAAACL
jgi:MFS family permease